MNVDINRIPIRILQAVLLRAGSQIPQSRLSGFLHNLAEIAGERHLSFALHHYGFDDEHIAPGLRPRQPHGSPNRFFFGKMGLVQPRCPQVLLYGRRRNGQFFG